MIRRQKVDPSLEWLVLSYMIMDKNVLFSAYSKYKSGQLKTSHFTMHFKPIFRWLIQYHAVHHRPPRKTIQKIYEQKKKNLNENSQEIIEEYLYRLSEEFSNFRDNSIDPDYICREILPNFIREREITGKIESAQDKIDKGKYKDAEDVISAYITVTEEDEDENLGTIIPYTKEDVEENQEQSKASDRVFKFDGDLHYLIGELEKTWLVAITGVEKSGKSYVLQDIAFNAALYQKKKVLVINLELGQSTVRNRNRRRISLTANKKDAGKIISPVLDCENNQYGTCRICKRKRNKHSLFKNNTEIVSYFDKRNWKICDKCRFDPKIRRNATKTKRFIPTIWFKRTRVREITDMKVKRSIRTNQTFGLSNLRIKCFPRFSVTFDEVNDYIRRYIDRTGWNPDIIIFDYLDILAPEAGNLQERIDVDRKWKKAARLAGELNCLVINADQATKASRTQYALDQMSTSESKTKDGHLDVRIAINQTEEENELDIARIGVLFHRHAKFNANHEVLITQRLETAEPLRDNVRLFQRGKKYHVTR